MTILKCPGLCMTVQGGKLEKKEEENYDLTII